MPALGMYGHAAGHMDIAILGIAVVRSLDHCTGGTVHNRYGSRAGHANVRSADARYGLGGNLVAHAIHFVFGTKLGSQVLEYGFLNLQRRGLGNNGSLIKKIIERIVRSQEHGLQEIDAYQLLQHLLSNALNHAGEYLVSHILRLPGLHFGNQAVNNLLAQICPGLLLLRIGQALVIWVQVKKVQYLLVKFEPIAQQALVQKPVQITHFTKISQKVRNDLLGRALLCGFVDIRLYKKAAGVYTAVSQRGQVLIGNNIDGYPNAYPGGGVGGRGICLYDGIRIVQGAYTDLILHSNRQTVADGCLGNVLLNVQRHTGSNLYASLACLSFLPVLGHTRYFCIVNVLGIDFIRHLTGSFGVFVCKLICFTLCVGAYACGTILLRIAV